MRGPHKSASYPDDLREFVLRSRLSGVGCEEIAKRVRRLWPAFPAFSMRSAAMMIGANAAWLAELRGDRSPTAVRTARDKVLAQPGLGGPAWSRPSARQSI